MHDKSQTALLESAISALKAVSDTKDPQPAQLVAADKAVATIRSVISADPDQAVAAYEGTLGKLKGKEHERLKGQVLKAGGFIKFAEQKLGSTPEIRPEMFNIHYYTCALLIAACLAGQEEFIPVTIEECSAAA